MRRRHWCPSTLLGNWISLCSLRGQAWSNSNLTFAGSLRRRTRDVCARLHLGSDLNELASLRGARADLRSTGRRARESAGSAHVAGRDRRDGPGNADTDRDVWRNAELIGLPPAEGP